MPQPESVEDTLELRHKKQVFRLLVVAQDMEMSVAEPRMMVRYIFGSKDADVCQIEREGISHGWPPLQRNTMGQ
jgi:hypothetical protein